MIKETRISYLLYFFNNSRFKRAMKWRTHCTTLRTVCITKILAFLDSAQNLALKKVRSEIDQDLDTSTIMVQAKYGTRATKLVLSDYCTYSRVPNKHDGMFIYSACKNPVRHAYCGRHAANDTLPMTRSCPLHTSNMCSVSLNS